MPISRLLTFILLFAVAAVTAQEKSSDDAKDADATHTNVQNQAEATSELPPQFIPKEKISPDQVISFPADI